MNIHFICRGNVLRSLVAETYLRSLGLPNITVSSSGTNVNWDDPTEKKYFARTLDLFKRHNIEAFAKPMPEQLTQQRVDNQDVTVCMNQRVIDEASLLVSLPAATLNWNIIDIGEGTRIANDTNLADLEEEVYNEITPKVDALVASLNLK